MFFTGRIWIAQVVQIIVTIIGVAYGVVIVETFADEVEDWRKYWDDHYTQAEAQNISNKDWITYDEYDLTTTSDEQDVLDLIPERW